MRVIDFFDKGVAVDPDRLLIISDTASVTYRDAEQHSWRLAAALHANGFELGDRVGVLAPNVAEGFLAMLGLWRAGGSWVPLNPLSALKSTVNFMNEVSCKWLLVHSKFAADIEEIRRSVPSLKMIVSVDEPIAGSTSLEEFLASGNHFQVPDWNDPYGRPEHECCAWPTGGTTGASKGVLWTNQVWATLVDLATRHWPAADHPVNLMVAPITHAAGVMAVIMSAQGGTVVIRPGFKAEDATDCIERHGVTHLFLPPTAYYDLLASQRSRPRDCSSLAMMLLAASPVSPAKFGQGVDVFGPCLAQCWGQAESPLMITYISPEEIARAAAGVHPERLASCGRATFSTQVAAMDDDGRLLGPGERGELVVRGRLVTPGYLGRPEATEEVRTFGWHHTGDIGYLDEDGFVYIVDRKKDMVITGGFNVYPAEVEAAILALPEVRECAVIGVPDDRWGEAVCAVVVAENDQPRDPDQIIAAAKTALGPVKAPKSVHFVDSIPKTPVGKSDKKALRAVYWKDSSRAVN
jgi:acyl-CoA synthetase (AMP-forming)/AMP-acid ligase II